MKVEFTHLGILGEAEHSKKWKAWYFSYIDVKGFSYKEMVAYNSPQSYDFFVQTVYSER